MQNADRPATSAGLQTTRAQEDHSRSPSAASNYSNVDRSNSSTGFTRSGSLVIRKRRSRFTPVAPSERQEEKQAGSGVEPSNAPTIGWDTKDKSSQPAKLFKIRRTERGSSGQLVSGNAIEENAGPYKRASSYAYGTPGTSRAPNQTSQPAMQARPVDENETLKPYFDTLRYLDPSGQQISQTSQPLQGNPGTILPSRSYIPVLAKPQELGPRPRRRLFKNRPDRRLSTLSLDISSWFSSPDEAPHEQMPQRRRSRRSSISDMLAGMTMSKKDTSEPKIQPRKLQRSMNDRSASAPLPTSEYSSRSLTSPLLAADRKLEPTRSISAVASYTASTARSDDLSSIGSNSMHMPMDQLASPVSSQPGTSPTLKPVYEHDDDNFGRPSRYPSMASDFTSSQIGSDMDIRVFSSGDEDDCDLRSETAYDSVRTGMTRASGTFPGALFDKDADYEYGGSRSTSLQEASGAVSPITMRAQDSVILEEDENAMTPKRVTTSPKEFPINQRLDYKTTLSRADSSLSTSGLLHHASQDSMESEPDAWSDHAVTNGILSQRKTVDAGTLGRWSDNDGAYGSTLPQKDSAWSHLRDDRKQRHSDVGLESKTNVFDWSEQPSLERGLSDMPPRPKTVHGKKNTDGRNSRPNSRRAPSGPHARSHSVPALGNDLPESRSGRASKFGTWGVGTKGATEDWDDDFDFDELIELPTTPTPRTENRTEHPVAILVPTAIREQQTSVLANIGLLKEWGVLIEELKQLRLRASSLGLSTAQSQSVFDEVDAMIDLADQEVDEPQFPKEQVSSSRWPDESEDSDRRASCTPSIPTPSAGDDVFGPLPLSLPSTALPSPTRPRKNSEAIARSVIEAVQKRRDYRLQPVPTESSSKTSSKVPFDKGTLRHILPHLQGLVKSMKTILRDADSFGISPRRDPTRAIPTPTFSQAFIAPAESPLRRCTSPQDGQSPLREGLTEIITS